jgi:hypothetical protein
MRSMRRRSEVIAIKPWLASSHKSSPAGAGYGPPGRGPRCRSDANDLSSCDRDATSLPAVRVASGRAAASADSFGTGPLAASGQG